MRIEDIRALADTHYDEGYDTGTERLFAFLVDVADAYVHVIRGEMRDEYMRAADSKREPVTSLGTLSGMDAIGITVTGLRENLEMRDEERES